MTNWGEFYASLYRAECGEGIMPLVDLWKNNAEGRFILFLMGVWNGLNHYRCMKIQSLLNPVAEKVTVSLGTISIWSN